MFLIPFFAGFILGTLKGVKNKPEKSLRETLVFLKALEHSVENSHFDMYDEVTKNIKFTKTRGNYLKPPIWPPEREF